MNTYNRNIGQVKETKEQYKKHANQMRESEKEILKKKIKKLKDLTVTPHLLSKNILKSDIDKLLTGDFDVIERNITLLQNVWEERVLIRGKEFTNVIFVDFKRKRVTVPANLCVVISLKTGKIITGYWNDKNDNHSSLHKARYEKNKMM